MSNFIFSMSFAGLMEMPPVSKVMALPTRPSTGAPGVSFSGGVGQHHQPRRFGAAARHGEQRAHFQFGDAFLVEDVDGQACLASHGRRRVRRAASGVSKFDGSLPSSRAKFCDSPMIRPRSIPDCAALSKPTRTADSTGPVFLSVRYLSPSKLPRISPSVTASAAAAPRSASRAKNARCFTERDFR